MEEDFTFAIIKPNAVKNKHTGPILARINEAGFKIAAMKMLSMSRLQAEAFYDTHRGKPFFDGLVEFMSSGPVVVLILNAENSVEEFRKLIGNTDPAKAEEGTIRRLFAASLQMNAIHGSDSPENARKEAGFFFSGFERFWS